MMSSLTILLGNVMSTVDRKFMFNSGFMMVDG